MSETGLPKHIKWADVAPEQLSSQVTRQYLTGTNMMLARVVLKKGTHVPEHKHHHEQIAYILEGAMKFVMGDSEVVVRAGEVLCIPSNVPHAAFALEDTIDLDVFNPPREDWLSGDDAYLRGEPAAQPGKEQ